MMFAGLMGRCGRHASLKMINDNAMQARDAARNDVMMIVPCCSSTGMMLKSSYDFKMIKLNDDYF
jgi:hypothetical protein